MNYLHALLLGILSIFLFNSRHQSIRIKQIDNARQALTVVSSKAA